MQEIYRKFGQQYGERYPKYKIICHENSRGGEMFLIAKGKASVYIQGPPPDYNRINIAELGPGDFFGEMSLLEKLPRFASIKALSDVKVLIINRAILKQVVKINPDFAIMMLKKFSSRLRKWNQGKKRKKQSKISRANLFV